MITLEKLTEFAQEDLNYKSTIKVISYEIVGNWIHIHFGAGMGEIISANRFYYWLNRKISEIRENKLNQIL